MRTRRFLPLVDRMEARIALTGDAPFAGSPGCPMPTDWIDIPKLSDSPDVFDPANPSFQVHGDLITVIITEQPH